MGISISQRVQEVWLLITHFHYLTLTLSLNLLIPTPLPPPLIFPS